MRMENQKQEEAYIRTESRKGHETSTYIFHLRVVQMGSHTYNILVNFEKKSWWNLNLKDQWWERRMGLEVISTTLFFRESSVVGTGYTDSRWRYSNGKHMSLSNVLGLNLTGMGEWKAYLQMSWQSTCFLQPVQGRGDRNKKVNKIGSKKNPTIFRGTNRTQKEMAFLHNYYAGEHFILVSKKNCESKKGDKYIIIIP